MPRTLPFLLILSILACEQAIEIELPPHNSRLVVNSFIAPGEPLSLKLSASSFLLVNNTNGIEDALVLLYENDQFVDTLIPHEGGYYSSGEFIPTANKSYEIRIDHPDYPSVSAQDYLPEAVPILLTSWTRDVYVDEEGYHMNRIAITFQDPAEVDNYYELIIHNIGTGSFLSGSISNDTLITREDDEDFYSSTTLFRDEGIEGELYELEVFCGYSSSNSLAYLIEFRTISKPFYDYKKSLMRHLFNQYMDFWDQGIPVDLKTNIENGYGVFAGFSSVYDTLQ